MPTQGIVRYQYHHSCHAIAKLLLDPAFIRARCEHFGERNIVVSVSEENDAVRVHVERESSFKIPAFIRTLINPTTHVRESCVWSRADGDWRGDYEVDATGVPGNIRGRTWLKAHGAGCLFESSFEVSTSVPLIGKRIERIVVDEFAKGLLSGIEVYLAQLSLAGDSLRAATQESGERSELPRLELAPGACPHDEARIDPDAVVRLAQQVT